jgi:short-subunit dehydrogenase
MVRKKSSGTGVSSLAELVSLANKRALITGSGAGIGRAIACRFAEAGADLELVDINEEGLNTVKEELESFNRHVSTHKVDLSKKQEIDALWSELNGKEPDIW